MNSSSCDYAPDYIFTPGEYVTEILEQRSMSQAELARRTGLSIKHVNQICQGAAAISADTAVLLDRATGVAAPIWLRLEAQFQGERGKRDEAVRLEKELDWLKKFPIAELKKRDFISRSARGVDQLREVLQFFRVAAPSAWEQVWITPTAYRLSQAFAPDMAALATWIRIGELRAENALLKNYDKDILREKLPRIRALVASDNQEEWQSQLKKLCAEAGVAIVVEKEIKGARVNGIVRWLPSGNPLLMLSGRHRWADIFWFTLFHEIGHLLIHDRRKLTFVDSPEKKDSSNRLVETEADDFASRILIPREYDPLIYSARSDADVIALAEKMGVHPGVVVGRMQHDRIVHYSQLNDLRAKFAFTVD